MPKAEIAPDIGSYNSVLDAACDQDAGYALFLEALQQNVYHQLSLGCSGGSFMGVYESKGPLI